MEDLERVTTRQAASELNMTLETLQLMLQENRLPIGFAFKKKGCKRYCYYIYRGKLDSYKKFLSGMSAEEQFSALYGVREDADDEKEIIELVRRQKQRERFGKRAGNCLDPASS